MKKISLFLFLSICISGLTLRAQRIGFSDQLWRSIKTEHFDIIFTAEQQDLGLYYARVSEKAYQNLEPFFTEKPERVVVIVNDMTDASNGYATRIPYPTIMAFSVQINDHDSLSESAEWARELITHEMTHILQFEPALGFYKFLRPLFGTIVAPNLLLPSWWKEGMAVELETQLSPRGRLRSLHQDATLRAISADKKLFDYTLASANEVLPTWPYGNRPYIFGSLLWSQLVKNKNTSSINHLTSRHGMRLPYMITTPIEELGEVSYDTVYEKTLQEINSNAETQIKTLEKLTLSPSEPLPISGQSSLQPVFSKPHQLIAFVESLDGDPAITIRRMDDTPYPGLKNRPTGQINSLVFHPTLPQIFFTKIDSLNSKEIFSDIYIYDISTDSITRLTTKERARDLRFSDDGKKILYIATINGRTQIKVRDFLSAENKLLVDPAPTDRLYSPIFWDQNTVLYIHKNSRGDHFLNKYSIPNQTNITLPLSHKGISFLRKSANTLYFTSSQNGVYNIYKTTNFKNAEPVTHLKTGVWSFALDSENNRYWGTIMTSDGFRVSKGALTSFKEPLPVISSTLNAHYKFQDRSVEPQIPEPEPYSSTGYLWPRYWIPYIAATSSSNGVYLQAQTSGSDPVRIHQYSLLANYQTDINKGGFIGSYTNSSFAVPFQIGALQSNQTFGSASQVVETKTGYFGVNPDMFKVSKHLAFQTGVMQQETHFVASTKHWGPYIQLTYIDYDQSIFQISPEKGFGAFLRYEKHTNISGSSDFNKAIATIIKYHSSGLPKHHALMLRLNALATFETISARFGTSNSSAFTAEDTLIPQFVLRGYPPYQFFGRSLWTINTEYRFPIRTIERGSTTPALFLKRLSGAIVSDGLGVHNDALNSRMNESHWSAGIEAKLETTVGYILPMNFVLGAYYPFSPALAEGPQITIGVQLGGF
ncbi:MAG: hypothetical protein A2622_03120 [Bdellovibrionales bacterium RIFCSPHIGHO2_01_FULL_40_29]|nr:MAG: hypothetical protein A2622_03120 [Bdellovibrionales bacterium RIFCSPHIGHO2_01_FULL_40_29]OFZ34064.1 MAG: hypothetical protein A3D17_03540 [Bdellovibrionales bacterium RIFCSPHIGHO2_02_FULL_40_15]